MCVHIHVYAENSDDEEDIKEIGNRSTDAMPQYLSDQYLYQIFPSTD
jgi:hypothetical protein